MNWYDVLEVSPSASPQVIRAAYKSLMQRYHPDKAAADAPPDYAQRATQLAQAYAVLSDPTQRQAYDRQLQRLATVAPAAHAPALHRPVQAAAHRKPTFGVMGWLGLCGLVLLGGVVFKSAVVSPSGTTSAAATGASANQALAPTRTNTRRVHLPGLVVPVHAQSPALAGDAHRLTVPSVVLELGPWQADQAVWRLGQPSSTEALQEALAHLSYEMLIAPDGETTLTHALQEAANAVLGPPTQPPPRSSSGAVLSYGVQSVVLPNAFSVR